MARIKIYENDLTGTTYNEEYSDIAFVPGFSLVEDPSGERDKPVLCYDEQSFVKLFGTSIPSNTCSDMEPDLDKDGKAQFDSTYDYQNHAPIAYRKEGEGDAATYYPIYARMEPDTKKNDKVVCYKDAKYTEKIDTPNEVYFLRVVSKENVDEATRLPLADNLSECLLAFQNMEVEEKEEQGYTFKVSKSAVELKRPEGGADNVWLSNLSKKVAKVGDVIVATNVDSSVVYYQVVTKVSIDDVPYVGEAVNAFKESDGTTLYVEVQFDEANPNKIVSVKSLSRISGVDDQLYFRYAKNMVTTKEGDKAVFQEVKRNTILTGKGVDAISEIAYQHSYIPDTTDYKIQDCGYVYARELLYQGLPVYYWQVNRTVDKGEIPEDQLTYLNPAKDGVISFYRYADIANTGRFGEAQLYIEKIYELFAREDFKAAMKDRGAYNFKYLTTGGYPIFLVSDTAKEIKIDDETKVETRITEESFKLISHLMEIVAPRLDRSKYGSEDPNFKYSPAYTDDNPGFKNGDPNCIDLTGRGDCVLLVDHEYKPEFKTLELRLIAQDLGKLFGTKGLEYCAMFTPWCNFTKTFEEIIKANRAGNIDLPASFAYLSCLANSLKNYANWNAIAGVARGKVKNLKGGLLTGNNMLTNTIANVCQADPETAETGTISINCITYKCKYRTN